MNTANRRSIMNRIMFIVFIIFITCTLITPGIAQEKSAAGKSAKDKTTKPSKVIIKARSRGDFFGTVTHVNTTSKTIAVRNKGIIVTFDVLNPIFRGYKNLEQIRIGDRIAISYTGNCTRVTKGTGMHSMVQQEATKPLPESAKQKHGSAKTGKGRPVRVKERTNSSHFRDVDNNNDGRITPVELSPVVPNLTVEDFKRYDKNGDGYLNESEYNAINKSVKLGNNR